MIPVTVEFEERMKRFKGYLGSLKFEDVTRAKIIEASAHDLLIHNVLGFWRNGQITWEQARCTV